MLHETTRGLEIGPSDLARLRDAYLDVWAARSDADRAALVGQFEAVQTIGALHQALSFRAAILESGQHADPDWWDALAFFLRVFIGHVA
jgi:hypothetical protein